MASQTTVSLARLSVFRVKRLGKFQCLIASLAGVSLACASAGQPLQSVSSSTGGVSAWPDTQSGGADTQSSSGTGGVPATNSSSCALGSEQCDCFGNGTCNAGLVCASNLCVNLSAWLSGSGGSSAVGTSSATGGLSAATTSSGGSSAIVALGGAGAGGRATGGTPATGGRTGTGGAATGGAMATGGSSFWGATAYSSTGAPTPADGHHNAGLNCLQCHVSGSTSGAPVWSFGGTIYKANTTTPAPNVQVGINDGTNLYSTYTAANGNFWLAGAGSINWAKAQVRIRNANGELIMAGATPSAGCNLCHNSTTYPRITAP